MGWWVVMTSRTTLRQGRQSGQSVGLAPSHSGAVFDAQASVTESDFSIMQQYIVSIHRSARPHWSEARVVKCARSAHAWIREGNLIDGYRVAVKDREGRHHLQECFGDDASIEQDEGVAIPDLD
jgi:hypothetical protein